MDKKLKMLEEIIGYTFKNEHLLPHALTHSSYANERHWDKKRCNERLEFLGDAVLEVVSSEFLFLNHPDMPGGRDDEAPGQPGMRTGSGLLRRSHFPGRLSDPWKGRGHDRRKKAASVVSDAMEAVIGAIYLDGGLANAKEFIHRFILNDIES